MEDRCKHGHLLAEGSDPITLKTTGPDGREKRETLLLRRHVVQGTDGKPMLSEFRPGTASAAYEQFVAGLREAITNPVATEGYKRAQAEAEAKKAATVPSALPEDDPAWTV